MSDAPHENAALLAAICAHPDEDTPRLMYADWLDEVGDAARAEFIRLHVEWDRRPPFAPPDDDLRRRLTAALEAVEPPSTWSDRRLRRGCHAYERGFLAALECDFDWNDDVMSLADSACGLGPVRVVFADSYSNRPEPGSEHLARFLSVARAMPALTGFGTELDYNYGLNHCWEHYLRSPDATRLRLLDFSASRGIDACPLVAELTHLTELLVLDLTVCCRFEDGELAQLTGAPHLQSLVALRLGAHDEYLGSITTDGIAELVRSPYLKNLRQLTLNNHEDIDDEGVSRLLAWDRVGQLEVLELSCRAITDVGVRALARAPQLRNLKRLVLDGRRLAPDTVAGLLDAPHLRGLTELYLSPPPVTLTVEVLQRLAAKFPRYARMASDPPPVCAEDRARYRYRRMAGPGGEGEYRGREPAYSTDVGGRQEPPLYPEYAVL